MPKLKLTEEQEKGDRLDSVIAESMRLKKMDNATLAAKMGLNVATLRAKRRNPRTFKMEEIWRICKILSFTDEQKAKII